MPREKFQTLTEQMVYILLCLTKECCGVDIMKMVSAMTDGRVIIGPGTLYSLLDDFASQRLIAVTTVENRRKSYIITKNGMEMLQKEYDRLQKQMADMNRHIPTNPTQ